MPSSAGQEKEPREGDYTFLSPKSFWSRWRNEAFTYEKNTRSDIPELNVGKGSPEVGGQRRKGTEVQREVSRRRRMHGDPCSTCGVHVA